MNFKKNPIEKKHFFLVEKYFQCWKKKSEHFRFSKSRKKLNKKMLIFICARGGKTWFLNVSGQIKKSLLSSNIFFKRGFTLIWLGGWLVLAFYKGVRGWSSDSRPNSRENRRARALITDMPKTRTSPLRLAIPEKCYGHAWNRMRYIIIQVDYSSQYVREQMEIQTKCL